MAGKTIGEQTRGKRPDPIAEAAIVHEPAEPRPPRMAAVETLGRGDHACVWFDGHEDRWALRAAFATVGLARGERVMFFPGPGTPAKEAIERLAAFGVPAAGPSAGAEAPIRRPGSARPGGHVEVIDVQPGYVRGRGLDVAARIRHWTKVSGETLAHGFTGLRAAGDMTWAVGADVDGGELAAYEAAMTGLLAKLGLTGVCEYDRGGYGPDRVPDGPPGRGTGGTRDQVLRQVRAAHPLSVLPVPGSLYARREGDALRLTGDADLATRGAFERALRQPGLAVIDLTGLAFIDAFCVRALLRLGRGVTLECTAAQGRLLELCGSPRARVVIGGQNAESAAAATGLLL